VSKALYLQVGSVPPYTDRSDREGLLLLFFPTLTFAAMTALVLVSYPALTAGLLHSQAHRSPQ
jgi:hypothetical protein